MNDLVRYAMEEASRSFGGNDRTFNATGFSKALTRIAGTSSAIDSKVVRVMLTGRDDVLVLDGGHYQIRLEDDDGSAVPFPMPDWAPSKEDHD